MATAVATLPASDLVLGRYRPLRPLGSGGSGSVWLARDETNGLDVALKIVPREGKAGTRAEREAEAAARLRHPRCLRAYACAGDGGNVYIAYEYVPGRTLRDRIRAGEVNDAAAVEIAAQILEGLAHAHANGIVHRDVKPTNVLVADGERLEVRLLDFGLAQFTEAETLTAAGDVPGTLAYISPERLRGDEATYAADIWAVGVLLWEALSGYHPFWSSSPIETAHRIEAGAPSLGTVRPDLSRELVAAVDRALHLDPARRPPALQLGQRLRDVGTKRRPRTRQRALPRLEAPPVKRTVGAAAGAVFVAGTAALMPFYPAGWGWGLAALVAAASTVRPRVGLALALAAAVLPLGNISLGLAVAYCIGAAAWIAATWRRPEEGLVATAGPLLAPAGALTLLPLAFLPVRSAPWRAVHAALGVLLAATAAGSPEHLGIATSEDPSAVATALLGALTANPEVPLTAVVLGALAALLPPAAKRSLWLVAGLGTAALMLLLLPFGTLNAVPVVAGIWVCCLALGVKAGR